MSSTNRNTVRKPYDFYPTPKWCVDRLLDAVPLPGGRWLEPGAGTGSIIKAVNARRQDVNWTAVEIQDTADVYFVDMKNVTLYKTDFLTLTLPLDWIPQDAPFQVAIGNPPYSLAEDFVKVSMEYAETVAMLLRLNFLGSEARQPFLSKHTPDVYVLPNRPSYTNNGKTDSIEYAWFVWSGPAKTSSTIKVLNSTPKHERKAP